MTISNILSHLEEWAPPAYQENYDNAGLLTGNQHWECTGVICTLDCTEVIVAEAIRNQCNLIVAHHPIIFKGLKKITPSSYVERTIIQAIKNDIAIYAIHTNLDAVLYGVNAAIAQQLGLLPQSLRMLAPKANQLAKLYTYVPIADADMVRNALFAAGAGQIGLYEQCSFNTTGTGTFKPKPNSNPTIGKAGGSLEWVNEEKVEVIFPIYLLKKVIDALKKAHPYEEVAYEVILLENAYQEVGTGMIGELPDAMDEMELLAIIQKKFNLSVIKHTPFLHKKIKTIAFCGGAGSSLIGTAIAQNADLYLTSDIKYHEFFDADGRLLLVDIGHWESEQFTIDLLANFLIEKFPTFAVLKTRENTNPVHYFV